MRRAGVGPPADAIGPYFAISIPGERSFQRTHVVQNTVFARLIDYRGSKSGMQSRLARFDSDPWLHLP
jgi:hypothetical protein